MDSMIQSTIFVLIGLLLASTLTLGEEEVAIPPQPTLRVIDLELTQRIRATPTGEMKVAFKNAEGQIIEGTAVLDAKFYKITAESRGRLGDMYVSSLELRITHGDDLFEWTYWEHQFNATSLPTSPPKLVNVDQILYVSWATGHAFQFTRVLQENDKTRGFLHLYARRHAMEFVQPGTSPMIRIRLDVHTLPEQGHQWVPGDTEHEKRFTRMNPGWNPELQGNWMLAPHKDAHIQVLNIQQSDDEMWTVIGRDYDGRVFEFKSEKDGDKPELKWTGRRKRDLETKEDGPTAP